MLRDELQQKMMDLVGVEKSVSKNMIRRVGLAPEVDWEGFCTAGTRFRIVIAGGERWVVDRWPVLLRRFREISADFEVYLPDPDAEYIAALSEQRGERKEDLARECARQAEEIERLWKAAAAVGEFKRGSRITISYLKHSYVLDILKRQGDHCPPWQSSSEKS